MGHVRGRDDVVLSCIVRRTWCVGKPLVEERGPLLRDKLAIWGCTELTARPAVRIAIDDEDGPIIGLAPRLRFRELRRVERAVTPTANNDYVSQRMSLPPSMTKIVPVA